MMGCPRSGTNLLYDTLLSSGGFAVYRGRLPVYQELIPRFGRLDRLKNREEMMAAWVHTKGFKRSELDAAALTAKVIDNCRCGGDFLRIVMDEIARKQQVPRWAIYSPDAVLRVAITKKEIPAALFVHMIRDGRDVALSLRKLGDFNPFPWSHSPRSLDETALYWEWMVQKGRCFGREIPDDYIEVAYEDLVADPQRTLKSLGEFLDHDLDYARIRTAALGTIGKSNSSFREEASDPGFNPVQRWKLKLSQEQIAALEWYIGQTLESAGYARTTSEHGWKPGLRDKLLRMIYPSFLEGKLWLKMSTPLGRFSRSVELDSVEAVSSNYDASLASR